MPRTGKAELVRLSFRILAAVDAEFLTRHELADRFGVSPQIVGRQIRFLRTLEVCLRVWLRSSGLGYFGS